VAEGSEYSGVAAEQKSAFAVVRWREGWDEERRVVYCCSICDEMSRPVAWVIWELKALRGSVSFF